MRIYYKDWILKNVKKREMTEAEKWVYLKNKPVFGVNSLHSYLKNETKKAIKNGFTMEYVSDNRFKSLTPEGEIIYAIDEFEDIIILGYVGEVGLLTTDEQKAYVSERIRI